MEFKIKFKKIDSLNEKDDVAFQKIIIANNKETSLTRLNEKALNADLKETFFNS